MEELDNDKVNATASKFPFIMILAATLFRGFLFFILNGPLIWNLLRKKNFMTLSDLYSSGVIGFFEGIFKLGGGAFSVSILIMSCMSIGMVLSPIDNLFSTLIPIPVNRLIKKPEDSYYPIFSQREFMTKEYAPFLSWLMMNPSKKAHWEWELFLYQLSWSIFTIVSVWSVLSLLSVQSYFPIRICLLYLVGTLFFMVFALARGFVLAKVHSYYFGQYDNIKEGK